MRLFRIFLAPSAVLLAMMCPPGAFANTLLPGGSCSSPCVVDNLTGNAVFAGGTFLATTGVTLSTPPGSGNTMSYTAEVYQEVGGTLDFLYQATPIDGDLGQLTAKLFGASLGSIDMGYATTAATFVNAGVGNGFVDGSVAPVADAWPSSTPDFSFTGAGVPVGTTSDIVVIRTDATTYSTGTVLFQDGGQSSGTAWQPAPEPAEAGVLLGGLFAAGLFVARKFRVQRS